MIKEIVTDTFLLRQESTPANIDDLYIVQDLIDTLHANHERCVGMAANMIGFNKNIIIFNEKENYTIMINPEIIKTSKACYECEEGCLSHTGTKKTKRYEKIKVAYLDTDFKKKIKSYEGFTAQIIQHEIDHCNGILI